MAITQNKLTPLLAALAVGIVVYVLYVRYTANTSPVPSGPALNASPQPGVDPSAPATTSSGMFGSNLPPVRPGDADGSAETLATVTASNNELRAAVEKVIADNKTLMRMNNAQYNSEEAIAARVREQLRVEGAMGSPTPTPTPAPVMGTRAATNAPMGSNPSGGLVDAGLGAASRLLEGMGTQVGNKNPIDASANPTNAPLAPAWAQTGGSPTGVNSAATGMPSGLGYDANVASNAVVNGAANAAGNPGPVASPALTRVIAPLGWRTNPAAGGEHGQSLTRSPLGPQQALLNPLVNPQMAYQASPPSAGKPELIPYFTIPENATLGRTVAMTTLVGRVPIDGRVQDPMQFKLVVGRDNLAASGQYVPDDIAGVVISGIAVGDMALSCTEGLIQSMTFVFDDGTIRTISQRSNGASTGFGSGGGGGAGGVGGQSLASASKLGWISDEYGNPCIPGRFVTNAPAYLSDVVASKALSAVGEAIAAAQTTVTTGSSALGSSTSSTVTGSQGRYVLGKVAGSGADEVTNWLIKRLNNSFDAVVVKAGTRVAVHIDQSISIDKDPEGRRLDYARGRADLAQQTGGRYGID